MLGPIGKHDMWPSLQLKVCIGNVVVDALMKDHSKYNGGCQPVTLSIRHGSAEDVSV